VDPTASGRETQREDREKTQKNAPDHYNPEHPNLLSLSYQRLQQMITICCCHRIHGRYCAVAFSSDGNQGNEPAHW